MKSFPIFMLVALCATTVLARPSIYNFTRPNFLAANFSMLKFPVANLSMSNFSRPNISMPNWNVREGINEAYAGAKHRVHDLVMKIKSKYQTPDLFNESNPFVSMFDFFGFNLKCIVNVVEGANIEGEIEDIWNEFINIVTDGWKPCTEIEDEIEQEKCSEIIRKKGYQIFENFDDKLDEEPFGVEIKKKFTDECFDQQDAFENLDKFE